MQAMLGGVRDKALKRVLKAFRPTIDLGALTTMLGFTGSDANSKIKIAPAVAVTDGATDSGNGDGGEGDKALSPEQEAAAQAEAEDKCRYIALVLLGSAR